MEDTLERKMTLIRSKTLSLTSSTSSYRVTKVKGKMAGIGGSVTGTATAKVVGNYQYSCKIVEHSQTYNELKKKYKINSGVSGFFAWISGSAHAEKEKSSIRQALKEIITSKEITADIHAEFTIVGTKDNVRVDAMSYVILAEIEDESGNKVHAISKGDPRGDTGAVDNDNEEVKTEDNTSTITI
ncbi:hypothetical protein LRP52_47265 [Photobacterium sp. ZSDE20]|uniref:Uncharacterized protein n=1 Tax=Photobacterium pectinilyticum TaxID=2906793 RepID=A0ABT1ND62_9GAMM|nr:hypothetical protein [Photobacterium sp. ZSDE20]MCQ1061269.1 hypothetical protein [Photobacterium sp. ZSDE20]MDD1829757.1 hypothetical protein [Photobacterium sp. ZSDE20]